MDDLKVSFRFGNNEFHDFSDLNEGNQERAKHLFLMWEKKVMHTSAIHSLTDELKTDASKVLDVSVETKESPTI